MAKPTSKIELIQSGRDNYEQLLGFIEGLSQEEQEQTFPEGTLNRNIRDILAHLHHWHLMFLDWYRVGMEGGKPEMPAKGYTWKMTPELNIWIQAHYADMELEDAKSCLSQSYLEIQQLIEKHSEEELFEKKRYSWTGSTSLGAYLISATASHYAWALKLIRRVRKQPR